MIQVEFKRTVRLVPSVAHGVNPPPAPSPKIRRGGIPKPSLIFFIRDVGLWSAILLDVIKKKIIIRVNRDDKLRSEMRFGIFFSRD